MNTEDIENLNSILEGEYMAIKSFESLIEHAKDLNSKDELQKIQQNHKQHASQISIKIQNLGGIPSDVIGIQGIVAATISNIKHIGKTDNTSYLKEALQGEYIGIKTVNELLALNNNTISSELLNTIVAEDQTNINSLNNLINSFNDV